MLSRWSFVLIPLLIAVVAFVLWYRGRDDTVELERREKARASEEVSGQGSGVLPASTEVDVTRPEGSALDLVCRDRDGRPVGGAVVRGWPRTAFDVITRDLLLEVLANPAAEAVADDRGEVSLGGVEGAVVLRAVAPGHLPTFLEHLVVPDGEREDPLAITLLPGLRIAGSVVDTGGGPVPGATVRVVHVPTPDPPRSFTEAILRIGLTETRQADAEGRFSFDTLLAGRYHVIGRAEGRGVAVARGVPAGRDDVRLVLSDGIGWIEGAVTDPDGAPVTNAIVSVTAGDERLSLFSVRVDGEGRYRLADLAPGHWDLSAEAPGWGREGKRAIVVRNGAGTTVDFSLGAAAAIAGLVVDPDDVPVEGATVVGFHMSKQMPYGPVLSAADGTFRLEGVNPGQYVLMTTKPGLSMRRMMGVPAPKEGLVVRLGRAGSIRGRCIDEEGQPVTRFGLNPVPQGTNFQETGIALAMGAYREFTSEDGTFLMEDIKPGKWFLDARASGFAPTRSAVVEVVESEETDDLVITFMRGATVRGRVVQEVEGPTGEVEKRPVEGAEVARMTMMMTFPMAPSADRTMSRADGTFELQGMPAGMNWLQVKHPEFASAAQPVQRLTEGAVKEGIEIVLERGGIVEGHVYDDLARPASGLTVMCQKPGGGLHQQIADTDARGFYRFERVTTGTMMVMLVKSFDGDMQMKSAAVENDETVVVDFGRREGCTIRGRVLAGGRPVKSAFVTVLAQDGGKTGFDSASTNAAGEFAIHEIEPGSYTVFAQDISVEMRAAKVPVTVNEGDREKDVEIEFPAGAIEGIVVSSANQEPVSGAQVFLMVNAGSPALSMTQVVDAFGGTAFSTADGRFAIRGIAPGTYVLRAQRSGYGEVIVPDVTVADGQTLAGVVVELPAEGALEGTVSDTQGTAIRGANLFLMKQSGEFSFGTSSSDASGHYRHAGVGSGTYTVFVQSRSHAMAVIPSVEVVEGETRQLDVTLTEGGTGHIVVKTAAGVPVPGAEITLIHSTGIPVQTWLTETTIHEQGGAFSTDAQGLCDAPHLMAGTYAVTATGTSGTATGVLVVVEGQIASVQLTLP